MKANTQLNTTVSTPFYDEYDSAEFSHSIDEMKYWKVRIGTYGLQNLNMIHCCLLLDVERGCGCTQHKRNHNENIHFISSLKRWHAHTYTMITSACLLWMRGKSGQAKACSRAPLFPRISSAPFVITADLSLWFTSNYAKIVTILKYWNNFFAVVISLYIYFIGMICFDYLYNEMVAVSLKCFTFSTVKSYSNITIASHSQWMANKILANNQNNGVKFFTKIIEIFWHLILFMIFFDEWSINRQIFAENWKDKKLTMNRLQIYNFITYWSQCWHKYLFR